MSAPAHKTQFFPPPPPASIASQLQYPPPPGQSPSPSQQQQAQATHYPPPPSSSSASPVPPQEHRHRTSLPLRNAATPESVPSVHQQQFAPPPQAPAEEKWPDEKAQALYEDEAREAEPQPVQFSGASAVSDDVGTFNGGSYRISHRDSNTVLTVQLAIQCPFNAKPGSMIAMSPSVILRGALKFSMKKLMAGGDFGHSTFIGPGEVLFAPPMLGDIATIRLTGSETWSVGMDSYLASTQAVIRDHKRQGLTKAMFSGEGLWVYKMSGTGLLWVTSFGAVIQKTLADGEKYIVDNGHLVAWNTKYILERVASGGLMSGYASAEGLVCKFTGPGTIYIQTRNARAFGAWMTGQNYKEA